MITKKALSRRTMLRGMGAAVALPLLDAMIPALSPAAKAATARPVRMAFIYVPNGIIMDAWNPGYEGKLGELPRILQPMQQFKDDILLLSNLTQNGGRAWQDGPGDHGRCCGAYLTGVHVRKSVVDIKAGVSCDQIVAGQVGGRTRFPSLEIGIEDARQAGDCDSGYSCAYTNNLSWKSETQPLPPVLDPRVLFERVFGDDAALSPEARARRNRFRRSILDFVREDTRDLEGRVGPSDRRKLDEYLSSIREIEVRLEKTEKESVQLNPGIEKPYGIPADFAEHFRLMTDMLTIIFQADLTRVVTFLVTREGSSRPYREIGISDGHHPLTHHRNEADMIEKVTQINVYHMRQFASWIEKLKSLPDGEGTILDNSMIVYGAGLSDGNRHTHEDLPVLMAGRGGGSIQTGRRVVVRRETPMCNLYLAMMDRMGVRVEDFGDSTGRLDVLSLS